MPSRSTATKQRGTDISHCDADHRKRRRNRTTQSCLNCHTTKRMCDRKRPCSRCTQLGLTGLCVYEVDDPDRRIGTKDESSRLRDRIAELEGVIRELKKKPHPRWLNTREDESHSPSRGSASSLEPSPSICTPPRIELARSTADMGLLDSLSWSPPTSSNSPYSHSPFTTPSPSLAVVQPRHPQSWYFACHGPTQAQDMYIPGEFGNICNCLDDPTCYDAVLGLFLGLRKSVAIMSRSASHFPGSQSRCLLNTSLPSEIPAVIAQVHGTYRPATDFRIVREQDVKIAPDSSWDDTGLPACDDSFMSWTPPTAKHPCTGSLSLKQ
ncbi:hypothetical protein B0H10DRAFT_620013 [Mycena sp. CBHHK59/15]|nr:hypothetical protein B0H10DRAFT_620013 [Mycena sp. CBHHK59/15]